MLVCAYILRYMYILNCSLIDLHSLFHVLFLIKVSKRFELSLGFSNFIDCVDSFPHNMPYGANVDVEND